MGSSSLFVFDFGFLTLCSASKVQHRGLRETCVADVKIVRGFVQLVHWLFPQVDYTWLTEELERNLPLELDFVHEANNARRAQQFFG